MILATAFCGTISATGFTVGPNGLGIFGVLVHSRLRCVSVVGKVLILGKPLRGGRVGDSSPSSRRATYSAEQTAYQFFTAAGVPDKFRA